MLDIDAVVEILALMGWDPEAARIAIRAGFKCEYCGRDFLEDVVSYKSLQYDHIIPLCCGGGKEDPENIAIACRTCNFNLKSRWDPRSELNSELSREKKIDIVKKYIEQKRSKVQNEIEQIRKQAHDSQALASGCSPSQSKTFKEILQRGRIQEGASSLFGEIAFFKFPSHNAICRY